MKQIIPYFILLLLVASCKKDETKTVYSMPAAPPVLTSSITSIVLDSNHRTDKAVTFGWTTVSYGIKAAITYSLEFDTSSRFTNANVLIMSDGLTKDYTIAELNSFALLAGLAADAAGILRVRVKAEVRQNGTSTNPSTIPASYSEARIITVTPYAPPLAKLWVPGDHNGWADPSVSPTLADAKGNGAYEGYIYFPFNAGGRYTFKILRAPNWNDPAYGYASDTKMVLGGGDLYASGQGYFLVKANIGSLDWSATKTTWSLIGDAITDWNTDTPMTYDVASGTWVVNAVALKSTGGFKFRANNDWPINYGPTNGKLVLEGGNISAPNGVAGNYKVVLNLSQAGNYTYSLTKL
jgi:hypothetical protein